MRRKSENEIMTRIVQSKPRTRWEMHKVLQRIESKRRVKMVLLETEIDWLIATIRDLDIRLKRANIRARRGYSQLTR